MLKLISSIVLLILCFRGNAQLLSNAPIDLTAGGEVFDMAYVPSLNEYLIVGNFTQINGQPRSKVAFLQADGTLSSHVLPWTINQTVFCCEAVSSNIYLGGNFTTIGATTRYGLARITITTSPNPVFTLNTWTPLSTAGTIHDMTPNGTNIIAVGDFSSINSSAGVAYPRNNMVGFTSGGSITPFFTSGALVHSGDDINRLHVERVSMGYLASGTELNWNGTTVGAVLFDFSGNFLQNITYSDGMQNTVSRDLSVVSDSLVAIERFYTSVGISTFSFNPQNGTTATIPVTGNTCYAGTAPQGKGIESYQGDLLFFDDNANAASGTLTRGTYSFSGGYVQNNCLPVVMTGADFNPNLTQHLKVVRNKMILSMPTMTSVNGQLHSRAAFFCLEPENAKPFTVFDTTICSGNERTYTVPASLYAEGYRWTYSGTGITYTTATQLTPQVFNGSVKLHGTTGNSITFQFGANATSGVLSVEPYSVCNATDTLFSKPKTLTIHTVVLPNLTLNADTLEFTCIVDTLNLIAQSLTSNVAYQWCYPNVSTPVSTNDTLTIAGSGAEPTIIYPTGMYYAVITEPVNGCKSADSVFVVENTIPPTFTQDSITISPAEFTCINTEMELNASVTGSTVYWTTMTDTTVHFSNPHTIYSPTPSGYYAFAISNDNGCKAFQGFTVTANYATINGVLPTHPNYPAIPVDTIDCNIPTLLVQCSMDPSDPNADFGTVSWVENGTTDLLLTIADSAGMYLNTNTYQFVTLNGQNGCYDTNDVVIFFDLNRPFVVNYSGSASLNCSVDTTTLVHPLTGGSVTESWLDGVGMPTGSNSLFVNSPGDYTYQVQYNQNGCLAFDTVTVVQTPEMYLAATPDTLVCPLSPVTVYVSAINVSETVSYTWSNGETDSFTTVSGGTDTLLTVIATTPGGCIGYDTVRVSVTDPLQITTAGFIDCGAVSNSLQVTSATGGAGNYQYSIDGITFDGNPLFDSLNTGVYTIYVKDALGCIYSFDDTLDATASAPEMDFLVTTYSGSGDTLAIINTTVFTGFDDIDWLFPAGTTVYLNSDSLALVQLPDTGWFEIILIGYDDTCEYTFSKTIYSGVITPQYPTDYNSVKIQSLIAYPNPSAGVFNVDIVFGTEQNYSVLVTNDLSQPVPGMNQTGFGTSISLPFTFPFGTSPGAYHVHVVSDYDTQQFTLILN